MAKSLPNAMRLGSILMGKGCSKGIGSLFADGKSILHDVKDTSDMTKAAK
jgi:hypothetical protein